MGPQQLLRDIAIGGTPAPLTLPLGTMRSVAKGVCLCRRSVEVHRQGDGVRDSAAGRAAPRIMEQDRLEHRSLA